MDLNRKQIFSTLGKVRKDFGLSPHQCILSSIYTGWSLFMTWEGMNHENNEIAPLFHNAVSTRRAHGV